MELKKYPNILLKYIIIIILQSLCWSIFAQTETIIFTELGEKDGLTGGIISGIVKDNNGYLWVSTREGLFHYDGNRFEQFLGYQDTIPRIAFQDIRALEKDKNGHIWLGTTQGVLSKIEPENSIVKYYNLPNKEEVKRSIIWKIDFDKKGNIWLAFERGIAQFNQNTEQFKVWLSKDFAKNYPYGNYAATYVVMVDNNKDNIIWVGSRAGMFKFDSEQEKFERLPLPQNQAYHIKISRFAIEYLQNDSLIYVFGDGNSIMAFHKEKATWQLLYEKETSTGDPRNFTQDSKGIFWLGTTDEGLGRVDLKNNQADFYKHNTKEPSSLSEGYVEVIYEDEKGVFWIGVENKLVVYSPFNQHFKHHYLAFEVPRNSFERFTGAYFQKNSMLYYTSRYNGFFHIWNRITNEEVQYHYSDLEPKNNFSVLWKIMEDHFGNMWAATDNGIYQLDIQNLKLLNVPWDTANILEHQNSKHCINDKDGNIWCIGNNKSILKIDVLKKIVKYYDCTKNNTDNNPKLNTLLDIGIDSKGYLWLVDINSVTRFHPETKDVLQFKTDNTQDKLTANTLADILITQDDVVWLYYKYNGFDRIDISQPIGKRIRHFGLEEGLPSNKVFKMVEDKNHNIWLATGNGLGFFDTKTEKITTYTTVNGLNHNDLHRDWHTEMLPINTGEIILSGVGYFTIFHPDSFKFFPSNPKLTFKSFKLFDKIKYFGGELNRLKSIDLDYDENYFTIDFTNLNYPYLQQPIYEYKLRKFDKQWRTTTTGTAEYTDVSSGQHDFQVRLINENHEPISEIISLPIYIAFPFWQTWWFYAIILLLIVGLLWTFYEYRIRQIKARAALKTAYNRRILEAEMTALRSQMNPHFLFNSLNSIKSYIIKNEPRIAAKYLTKFSQLMRLILNNSNSTYTTLEEELKALKIYIELEQLRFSFKFDFEINIAKNVNSSIQIPPLILQPYVENSIWHGLMHKEDNGLLTITVDSEEEALHIKIIDNGIGRVKAQEIKSKSAIKRKSMGIQITKERLEMFTKDKNIQAIVNIEDLYDDYQNATGTCVHIIITF